MGNQYNAIRAICKDDCFNCPFPDCRSSHERTRKEGEMLKAAFYEPDHSEAIKRFYHRFELTRAELKRMQKAASRPGVVYGRKRGRPAAPPPSEEVLQARLQRKREREREYQRQLKAKDPEAYRAKQREYYQRKKEEKQRAGLQDNN